MRTPTAAACMLFVSLSLACSTERSNRCPPCPSASPCPRAISPLVVSSALPLDLPKASQGGEPQTVLEVTVQANGEMSVNGKAVQDLNVLVGVARAQAAANHDLRATIRADRMVTHGRVIEILDALGQAGIAKVAFAVSAVGSASP